MQFFKELGYMARFMDVEMHLQKQQINSILSSEHCTNKFIHFLQVGVVHHIQACPNYFKIMDQKYCEKGLRVFLIQLDVYFALQFFLDFWIFDF